MKIVHRGFKPKHHLIGKRFECSTCHTIIEFEEVDLSPYIRGQNGVKKHYDPERYAPCPVCGDQITFSTDEVPQEDKEPPRWLGDNLVFPEERF